ncbi:TPA: polysaccharide pyruvyl transferase, partial [Klebsiella pneumoniae]|nr:polysaccharide pyruvyl transferase [Klebsiella pneumoniae]
TKRSSELFSSYDEIITSRMHGHILSCLVDTPNKILDNSYGKNSGYYSQWTSGIDSAVLLKN